MDTVDLISLRSSRGMRTVIAWGVCLSLLGAVLVAGVGCASSEQTDRNAPADSGDVDVQSETVSTDRGPAIADQDGRVHTVQLYKGADERALPVVSLRGSEFLTLEFDLMVREGRPVTASFHHADREWSRDLSPTKVLESYHTDNLLDYRTSQGTDVPYVHYTYRFPNDDIRFRLSGNYILRVTERGRPDSVLFERPFFVTDATGDLRLGGETIPVPGQRQQSIRPVALYEPPVALRGDPFGYSVCFVRNGRLPDTRCKSRPLLAQRPRLRFELDRGRAFAPVTADYTVDLGNLRSGSSIQRTDRTVTPLRVFLEADYARFSGRNLDTDLNGQIVIRDAVRGRGNPQLTAEYVQTTFAFVPFRERPLSREPVVAGSFSRMDPAHGIEMHWVPSRRRYEGDVLLKQGRYEYFYETSDLSLQRVSRRSESRSRNTYTTFVYYEDPAENTDRLLRVNSFQR